LGFRLTAVFFWQREFVPWAKTIGHGIDFLLSFGKYYLSKSERLIISGKCKWSWVTMGVFASQCPLSITVHASPRVEIGRNLCTITRGHGFPTSLWPGDTGSSQVTIRTDQSMTTGPRMYEFINSYRW